MKVNEQLKGLKGAMDNEFSKVLPNLDPSSATDFFSAANEIKRNVGEETDIIKKPIKKSNTKKILNKSKMKLPIGKLFSIGKTNEGESKVFEISKKDIISIIKENKKEVEEKWSEKYKKSIDCNNPKGFSQKAHCQGRKKKGEQSEATGSGAAGGFVGPVGFDPKSDFVKRSFSETPKKVETKEATGSASSGSYVTPAAWAKSTSKKHWRGKSKTQIPGGKFVQVKKKCKKFPYCNQGDIKALKFTNESELNSAIKNISEREGISENLIKQILLHEYNRTK